MTFDQIQSFYLAATLGTFRQAAERLHTTQPGISARIGALENHLNVSLFSRKGHKIALTPEGRRFLTFAEDLLEIQSMAIRALDNRDELNGVIRIGASDTMAITWIPECLGFLRKKYSEATFELHVGPSFRILEELQNRELDIAFILGPNSGPEMVDHPLCTCPMVTVASPALGLGSSKIDPKRFEKMDVVTFERLTLPYQQLRRDLRNAGISAANLSPVTSLPMIILMVKKGLGIGVIPRAAVEEELASGDLIVVDVDVTLTDLTFSTCYLEGADTRMQEKITHYAMQFIQKRAGPGLIIISYQV